MFYTYFHTRNDTDLVFYIGKGKGKRYLSHSRRSSEWVSIVKDVGFTSHLAMSHLSEKDAFAHERFLIGIFRQMGVILVNKSSGGEGYSGWTHCESTKNEIRMSKLGRTHNKETKNKISESLKKQTQSNETKEKRRQSMIRIWSDPERKANHLNKMRSDVCRQKISKNTISGLKKLKNMV